MTAFDLSEAQANYILELRLRRLTKFSRIELETERDELLAAIASLREILENPKLLRKLVKKELREVSKRLARRVARCSWPRRHARRGYGCRGGCRPGGLAVGVAFG